MKKEEPKSDHKQSKQKPLELSRVLYASTKKPPHLKVDQGVVKAIDSNIEASFESAIQRGFKQSFYPPIKATEGSEINIIKEAIQKLDAYAINEEDLKFQKEEQLRKVKLPPVDDPFNVNLQLIKQLENIKKENQELKETNLKQKAFIDSINANGNEYKKELDRLRTEWISANKEREQLRNTIVELEKAMAVKQNALYELQMADRENDMKLHSDNMRLIEENAKLNNTAKELKVTLDAILEKLKKKKEKHKAKNEVKAQSALKQKKNQNNAFCQLLETRNPKAVPIIFKVIPYLNNNDCNTLVCASKEANTLLSSKQYWHQILSNIIKVAKKTKDEMANEIKRINSEDIRFGHLIQNDPEIEKLIVSYILKKKRVGNDSRKAMKFARDFIDYHQIEKEPEGNGMLGNLFGNIFGSGTSNANQSAIIPQTRPSISTDSKLNSEKKAGANTSTSKNGETQNTITKTTTYISLIGNESALTEDALIKLIKDGYAKSIADPKNETKKTKWLNKLFATFSTLYVCIISSHKEEKEVEKLKDFLTKKVDRLKLSADSMEQEMKDLKNSFELNKKLLCEFATEKQRLEKGCMIKDKEIIDMKNRIKELSDNLNTLKDAEEKIKLLMQNMNKSKDDLQKKDKKIKKLANLIKTIKDYIDTEVKNAKINAEQEEERIKRNHQ